MDESDVLTPLSKASFRPRFFTNESETHLMDKETFLSPLSFMTNHGVETVSLQFTDTCRAEMWVLMMEETLCLTAEC